MLPHKQRQCCHTSSGRYIFLHCQRRYICKNSSGSGRNATFLENGNERFRKNNQPVSCHEAPKYCEQSCLEPSKYCEHAVLLRSPKVIWTVIQRTIKVLWTVLRTLKVLWIWQVEIFYSCSQENAAEFCFVPLRAIFYDKLAHRKKNMQNIWLTLTVHEEFLVLYISCDVVYFEWKRKILPVWIKNIRRPKLH